MEPAFFWVSHEPGGVDINPPLVFIVCCALKNVDMNSKLLDNFNFDTIEALVKKFFENLQRLFRKLTANNTNSEIFSIEKTKKSFFPIFTMKNIKYYFKIHWQFFWEFFWGIARFCRSKNDDFRNASWFRDIFTKNA